MNNCIKYNFDIKSNILKDIIDKIEKNIDAKFIFSYINPKFISLSNNDVIRLFSNLDSHDILKGLQFINSNNTSENLVNKEGL